MSDGGQYDASTVPILLYHDVTAEPADVYGVTPQTFARHMQLVAGSGRTPLTIDEYVDARAGTAAMPERPVLVTFDDGYPDFGIAVEAMLGAGVAAGTIYVTTQHADTPGGVPWSLLSGLPERFQVGAHSRTHPQLDLLPQPTVEEEVRGAKADVEDRLGQPCRSFAYPHGIHGRAVRQAAIDAGYDSAAAVKNALSHPDDDVFALARVTITQETGEDRLAAVLDGRGAPLSWRGERLRTKVFRAYRRHAPGGARHV